MDWSPRLTVATIAEREGRFLLVEEYADGAELVYNQPAGHLDEHETLAAAAIRETLEETAWEIQIDAVVGVYYWTHPKGDTFIRTCFAGTALRHHPDQALDRGIQRVLWLTRRNCRPGIAIAQSDGAALSRRLSGGETLAVGYLQLSLKLGRPTFLASGSAANSAPSPMISETRAII